MISVERIVLTKRSREALSKRTGNCLWDNVSDSIEFGNWSVPGDTTEFSEIRDILVKSFREFFSLPDDDPVEIKRFETRILSFSTGIYPDYTVEDGDPDS